MGGILGCMHKWLEGRRCLVWVYRYNYAHTRAPTGNQPALPYVEPKIWEEIQKQEDDSIIPSCSRSHIIVVGLHEYPTNVIRKITQPRWWHVSLLKCYDLKVKISSSICFLSVKCRLIMNSEITKWTSPPSKKTGTQHWKCLKSSLI